MRRRRDPVLRNSGTPLNLSRKSRYENCYAGISEYFGIIEKIRRMTIGAVDQDATAEALELSALPARFRRLSQ
jgi:hypothetical protein